MQLIEAVRAEHPDLPVILATGYSDAPAFTDAKVVRLAKPFMQNDLARAIAASVQPQAEVVAFRPR